MARQWTADVEISTEQARALIEGQFPALAPSRLERLGIGWDNSAFLVNGQFVFRFPRRRIAAGLIARENHILPLLAPHLPLPIPAPVFAGQPDEGYPYPFAGYERLSGATACQYLWSDAARADNALPLAAFLAALHRLPVAAETRRGASGDDIGRADLAKRAPMVRERLRAVAPIVPGIEVAPLLELVDRLAATPPHPGPACWVHGDLYARHLLVNDARQPCGIIDWGDVHLGDPALDLSIAFSFLPSGARQTFRKAYGPVDSAAWDRARFRALSYGAILVEYGTEIGDDALRAAGEYALRSVSL
jgi:aminoglycoside phosphotransferase (APT) family kinase protein